MATNQKAVFWNYDWFLHTDTTKRWLLYLGIGYWLLDIDKNFWKNLVLIVKNHLFISSCFNCILPRGDCDGLSGESRVVGLRKAAEAVELEVVRLLAGVAEVAEAEEGRTPDPWAAAAWAAAAAAAAAILLCTAESDKTH